MSDQVVLKPGESRVVRELPCPPEQMARPNEYWLLYRASRRLLQATNYFDPNALDILAETVRIMKTQANEIPSKPRRNWISQKLGTVYEICCPNCANVFEFTGKFYVPFCKKCARWLEVR